MLNITLSLQQTAEVVTDLSRGKTAAQVAARKRLPIEAVDATAAAYGPGRADLASASRRLNKQLRDQKPVEDLDVDVPETAPRRAMEPEIENDRPDVRVWTCHACGWYLMAPEGTSIDDAQAQIGDHVEYAHPSSIVPEEPTAPAGGYTVVDVTKLVHDLAFNPDPNPEASVMARIPATALAHNHTDEDTHYPTCPACRAAAEVPLVIEGELADGTEVAWDCIVCDYGMVWSGPLNAEEKSAFDRKVTEHLNTHEDPGLTPPLWFECNVCGYQLRAAAAELESFSREIEEHRLHHETTPAKHNHPNPEVYYGGCPECRREMAFTPLAADETVPTNGHDVEEIVDRLLAQFDLNSDGPQTTEAIPATGPQQPSVGVEEPPAAPAPDPALSGGWLASGPRTVERLLDKAEKTGSDRLVEQAAKIKGAIALLADDLDRWVATADQRKAILHELGILGRRQDELTEKLARLDAGIPEDLPVDRGHLAWPKAEWQVVSQTSPPWREVADAVSADLVAESLHHEPPKATVANGFEVFPKPDAPMSRSDKIRNIPFNRMSIEARARLKVWATANGLPVINKGMQPKATVAAYLAAHPEDGPE